MRSVRLLVVASLMGAVLCTVSCTIAKPVVCAVTTPARALSEADGKSYSPEPNFCGLVAVSAMGAAAGLVTGFLSDINFLLGVANDPARNIHDPFKTNTSRR